MKHKDIKEFAKSMRKNPTEAEAIFGNMLKQGDF
jgi:hypothetical protein